MTLADAYHSDDDDLGLALINDRVRSPTGMVHQADYPRQTTLCGLYYVNVYATGRGRVWPASTEQLSCKRCRYSAGEDDYG